MNDSDPKLPVLQRMNAESEMFTRLSDFQKAVIATPPVPPVLPAVLSAALPALEAGFAYTSAHWHGELTVTLHYQGAELGSSAPAPITSYTETTARLLAGLLGIPLLEGEQSFEAESEQNPVVATVLEVVPDPVKTADPIDSPTVEPVEDEEPDEFEAADDVTRPLDDKEKAAAIDMVKVLPVDQRKAFTKTFREVFQVPPDAKQIAPFFTELRHLHFIDRFTVEAAGGIAA
jgi:hypothetical protein